MKKTGFSPSYVFLDKDYIISSVGDSVFDLELFSSVYSTSEYLKNAPRKKLPSFCLAEQQTQGKGRLGRDWHSPFGQNIYMSCCYPFQKNINELFGLSLVVALAVIDVLKQCLYSGQIKAKWPNDVFVNGKKIAGILVDVQVGEDGGSSAIIGIGLNVNMMTDKDNNIAQAWTSMCEVEENDFSRNEICILLIDTLLAYLRRFAVTGLSDFINDWKQVDYLLARKISIEVDGKKNVGIVRGINNLGQLLLEFSNNDVQAFSSGNISILCT